MSDPTAPHDALASSRDASPAGSGAPASGTVAAADVADQRRSADLALARLHLRSGSLALARAELETMAGRDALDEDGLLDLAEARWRTGDTAGAGEAAAVILGESEDGPLIALVVAAEAAVGRGRPTEARRYAARALEQAGGAIDTVFAGMPRGPVWPPDAAAVDGPAPTLFDLPASRRGSGEGAAVAAIAEPDDRLAGSTLDEGAPGVHGGGAASLALWSDGALGADGVGAAASAGERSGAAVDGGAATPSPEAGPPALPSGDDALRAGEVALSEGRIDDAATRLGLALRLAPALASRILDLLDDRRDVALAFVRGDAYRLLGREEDARRAFADALGAAGPTATDDAPDDPLTTDPPTEGDPA